MKVKVLASQESPLCTVKHTHSTLPSPLSNSASFLIPLFFMLQQLRCPNPLPWRENLTTSTSLLLYTSASTSTNAGDPKALAGQQANAHSSHALCFLSPSAIHGVQATSLKSTAIVGVLPRLLLQITTLWALPAI